MANIRSLAASGLFSVRWALLVVSLVCSPVSAEAKYRFNAGDVIEISIAGMLELRQRVTVQLDGSISLPLLETLNVAGSSVSEGPGYFFRNYFCYPL